MRGPFLCSGRKRPAEGPARPGLGAFATFRVEARSPPYNLSMTSALRIGGALIAGVLALVACSDEPRVRTRAASPETSVTAPATPRVTLEPTPVVEGACANQAEVTSNPLNRSSGPLIGDVTGDATPERIYVTVDQAGPPGCQAFVVVSEAATVTSPIEGWDPSAGVASPTLNRLVQIDGRPGAEIVVNLAAGASTQFVGAFSVAEGTVERLATAGDEASSGTADLFAFGGSVGHLEAVDCTNDGEVVLSSAIPKADRYQVTRRFFTPSGANLDLNVDASRRLVVTLNELEDFPEFGASPFGSCPSS
jgi:hypothetical protein